jgi:MFS family permease
LSWREAYEGRDFRFWQAARFLLTLGIQIQSVAIGWQVYDLTHRPLDLGWVGFAQFVPMSLLSLVGGQVSDRVDRVRVLQASMAAIGASSLILLVGARTHAGMLPIAASVVLFGAARAFAGPAASALLPQLVSKDAFPSAVALNSVTWQTAAIAGPAVGGAIYAVLDDASGVYAAALAMMAGALALVSMLTIRTGASSSQAASLDTVLDGIRYVRDHRLVLGAMALDLFAVLLGGAVALLPVYAKDYLDVGPWGLGILRSAPAVGAALMALILARWPLTRNTGGILYASIAVFGFATIVFGLSSSFALSLFALSVTGASDMVSIVVRSTLIQLHTPPAMRGRVGAVSQVFIGASNELGEFESGVTAAALGARGAVVAGGLGTLAVVGLWSWAFPELRRMDRADAVEPGAVPTDTPGSEAR